MFSFNNPQAAALRTRPLGIVEGKHLGGQFGNADATIPASRFLAEENLLFSRNLKESLAFGKTEGEFHRIGEAAPDRFVHHQAINDHADRVLFAFLERDVLVQEHGLSVDFGPGESVLPKLVEELSMLSFLGVDERRQDLNTGPLRQGQNLIDNLGRCLRRNLQPAPRAVGLADPCKEESQVIIDFRDGAYGGTGIAAGRSLFDRNGGREALDCVHIRLIHLLQELAGIGR